jgi:hypothetical protein
MSVFAEDSQIIMQNPAGISRAADSQNEREHENRIKLTPKPIAAIAIQWPRP